MNIFELLKKIFSKKEVGIINLSDIVPIPNRKELDNPNLADEYMKLYIRLINENKISSYVDSRLNEIKSRIDMYTNFLTNACYSEDLETYSLVNLNKKTVSGKKMSFELLSVKLNIYLSEIKKLTSEVDYMLVAFHEILEEKLDRKHKIFYLSNIFNHNNSDSKINSLTKLINSLMSSKLVLNNLEKASTLTLEAAQVKIKTAIKFITLKYGELDKELEKNAVKKLRKKVSKDIKRVQDLQEIESKNKKTYIVANTLLLEEYVYTHKEILNDLLEEIESKFEYITSGNVTVDIDLELNWIHEIEHLLNIFKTYGRDLSLDEYLERLYELKFEVMTYELDNPISIFSTANSMLENKIYEDIILIMVDCVLNDRLGKLDCFGSKKGQAISIIGTLLKDKNNKFDPHEIQYKGFVLQFLLYYFRKDIDTFMNKYLERRSVSPFQLNSVAVAFENIRPWFGDFGYDKKLSYQSVIILIDWDMRLAKIDYLTINKNNMYHLYELNRLYQANSKYYKLPEGIVTLNFNLLDKNVREKIYKAIVKQSTGKTLVCPSTLKEIINCHKVFQGVTGVVLNDGLKTIYNSFNNVNIERLSIPASVNYIGDEEFNWKNIKYLEFRDYQESKMLKSSSWLENLIIPSLIKNEKRNRFSSNTRFFGEVTNLEKLVFSSKESRIVLDKDDLNSITIVYEDMENKSYIFDDDYKDFLEASNDKILERSKDNFIKRLK